MLDLRLCLPSPTSDQREQMFVSVVIRVCHLRLEFRGRSHVEEARVGIGESRLVLDNQ